MFRDLTFCPVPARKRLLPIARLLLLPGIVVIASYAAYRLGYFDLDRRRDLAAFVERNRELPVIQLLYVAGYALVALLCLPAVVATILGGAFFGWFWGGVLAWCGQIVGTTLTHTLSARVARRPFQRLFGNHRLLRQLRNDVGVLGLFRLRVLPIAPFGVFAYIAGIAGLSLTRLLIATAVAMLPSIIAYGYVGTQLMRGLVDPESTERALRVAGYVTIAMLAISMLPLLFPRARSESDAGQ
jgi:uncharacterized membrane protein YdjX (TVP38/TMEM64 family)